MIRRFGIYLAVLDPTVGREIGKTRPCLVISPDEMHRCADTVIIGPMTSTRKGYPTRVACEFSGKRGEIALDQIRSLDRSRFRKCLGELDAPTQSAVVETLLKMFG